jgi:hypothetical protein
MTKELTLVNYSHLNNLFISLRLLMIVFAMILVKLLLFLNTVLDLHLTFFDDIKIVGLRHILLINYVF